MNIKHICFITPDYPAKNEPVYTFVKQLICSIAELGYKCSVIAPQSLTERLLKKRSSRPIFWQDPVKKGIVIDIYQPKVISFSNLRLFGRNISTYVVQKSVAKTFAEITPAPDVLYAHFWHSGVIAGMISKKYSVPFFVASGESKIWVESLFTKKTIDNALSGLCGVICVSTKNMNESIELALSTRDKMTVIPNAIDPNLFYKIDKDAARRKLGFNKTDFIIAFTGSFDYRKGIMRLDKAIKQVGKVKAIYIGAGELTPKGDEILFAGKLPHERICDYLNCADVFVLPTIAEGCSNSILEAMACGLPIISSNLDFNDDILTANDAIRVNSMNVEEIKEAINRLIDDDHLCRMMGESALVHAKEFDINNRAIKVMSFIKNILDGESEVQNDN
ncbi:glycosyltransferase [Acetobacterium paludosum]|uniref:Glycosyltransferase n=1 Tax=Acetobacterium paludosum TaxID=52693 RepID=A0A923KX51_9FIRM|nr:glycosyltransferase family 4 protein [Acetobacterium paludosum]MBC3888873.1 glycosyltransferase [Acetobacterium paludosum]